MNEYPSHIEVADHFYHDGCDLLSRYRCCFDSDSITFYSIKSRRMKCFVDLRMALEALLKAYTAYYCHSDIYGKKLVKEVEGYSHYLEKTLKKCAVYLPGAEKTICERYCDELKKLPVGLRYRLDVMDFIREKEEVYYSTIGSDIWMGTL